MRWVADGGGEAIVLASINTVFSQVRHHGGC